MPTVTISNEMLDRYNRAGPRYTSYPTVPYWTKNFGEADYKEALAEVAAKPEEVLSVYVHLPFCAARCHYCGCNATSTNRPEVVDAYLDRLEREVTMIMEPMGTKRKVTQLHWGGGTPNFLNEAQMTRVYRLLERYFEILPTAEVSLELDPRIATRQQLETIKSLGFNRVSLGVQDFNPKVQEAIGRIQPADMTKNFYWICREIGFQSVNVDIVYGLPYQTAISFQKTLDEIVTLKPDRIASFSYAHLPSSRTNQKQVDATGMPNHYEKFALLQMELETLTAAGYDWIGMDHFARSTDDLAIAARERRLFRNFMGYTTMPAPHQLAFGMSSISDLAGRFVQNDAHLGRYQKGIDAGHLPIDRGMKLSADDKFRRRVIMHMMCNAELPYNLTKAQFGVDVREVLGNEIERLRLYVEEGLVSFEPDRIEVTEVGRYFLRNLCMELDPYLAQKQDRPLFSRTI